MEPYEDDQGRMRLRLVWETSGRRVARVMTRRGQPDGSRFPGANHGCDEIDCMASTTG
jgi:hypothetical protein